MVGDERAPGAARVLTVYPVPVAEHEVVDEQLRAPVEELGEGLPSLVGLEDVLLLHRHPGQLLASPRELVPRACAASRPRAARGGPPATPPPFQFDVPPSAFLSVSRCLPYIVSKMANDPFKALAHPLRRDIVER